MILDVRCALLGPNLDMGTINMWHIFGFIPLYVHISRGPIKLSGTIIMDKERDPQFHFERAR